MSTPCIEDLVCSNGDFMKGNASKCALCRLSPDNLGRNMAHYWQPTRPAKASGMKHPLLEREKREKKLNSHLAKLASKYNRDSKKCKISRLARYAEKKTEQSIIKATKNSGRSNKDGDHVLFKSITLDTKLQTTRNNPIIRLDELEKVRQDASRAGKSVGGLLIRNKHGVGVLVIKEEDIPKIIPKD